jgi:alkylation response protein AidB-like acyl-CoA dehydrogenase
MSRERTGRPYKETDMANYWKDNDDLQFQFSQLDWAKLIDVTMQSLGETTENVYGAKDTAESVQYFESLLEQMGEWVSENVAPHWKELDDQHPSKDDNGDGVDPPRMATIMKGLAEMGAMGLSHSPMVGGLGCPQLVTSAFMELLGRADVSTMSHFGFHGGIGQALSLYAMEEGSFEQGEDGKITSIRFQDAIAKLASGEEWGAMVLTEPQAGSDLAQIKGKAELQEDGSWRITSQKIYITSGHGEHHVVIVRSEPEETHPGLKGLSLFYVPAHIEKDGKRVRNFEIGGFEEKMGQHSAAACTINYDGSYGELIGKRGHGFRGMLLLMNNARIAVGFESLGIMENAYRRAKDYAEERVTMGKPIAQHEMIADYLDEMDVLIKGLRAITFDAAFHEEMASRQGALLKIHPPKDHDEQRVREKEARRHKRRARHLTPLIKYIGGEECVRFARMAMQIYGGIGYIKEAGAEKVLRDALVVPVYEGTSQIQALMALKDNLQAMMRKPGLFVSEMASARLESVSARDPLDRGMARMRILSTTAKQTIITNIAANKLGDLKGAPVGEWKSRFMNNWDPSRDFSFGMLHAERLTKIISWDEMAQALVKQAHAAEGTEHEEERREIAERFLERFEVRARGVLAEIENEGSLLGRLLRRRKNGNGKVDEAEAA